MKIARSIKRKKISARERERETFGTRREGWFPFELVAWLDVVSSGPRQHASQTLIKRVAGTRGPTHLSAVCLSSLSLSLHLLPFFPLSSPIFHRDSSTGTKNRNDSLKLAREGGQKFRLFPRFKTGARDPYLSIVLFHRTNSVPILRRIIATNFSPEELNLPKFFQKFEIEIFSSFPLVENIDTSIHLEVNIT